MNRITRRQALQTTAGLVGAYCLGAGRPAHAAKQEPKWQNAIQSGLAWVAKTQSSLGHWPGGQYPTAMTALAGAALVSSGSTTTQGPYATNIRRAVNYL